MKKNKYIKLIYQFAVISTLCLFNYVSKAQTITTSPILITEYCGGANITVDYTITGTFGGSNVFTAQLSNASGSFSSPLTIGQVISLTSGSILATIPANTGLGLGYRIRVVGSSPLIPGSDNGTDLKINPIPTANAGLDQVICASTNSINLSGAIGGSASSSNWSTLGTGSFNSSTSLNAIYTPSVSDKSVGFVKLVLSTNGPIGACAAANDTMNVTINQIATVDAGPDQVICGNSSVIIQGTFGGSATSGSWTSTTNSPFISFTAQTEYFPTPSEIANGFVVLTYTSNDPSGPCAAAKDSLVVALLAPAFSNAGPDQFVCASNDNVALTGTVSGTVTTGSWRTLGSGAFTNANSLITNYSLSPNDISNGFVKLILTSSDPIGPCKPAIDTMIITISPEATVDAGPDQIICSNSSVNITGTIGGSATSGNWTSSTNSSFLSFGAVTDYFPTPAEILNGFVVLTYTSDDPIGPCGVAKDSLLVTLVSPPFADAGLDQTVCSNVSLVNLSGNFGNGANFANWSTLGTGTFINILGNTAQYIPSTQDKLNGFVKILYTTDRPAVTCNEAVDTMTITFNPTATIFAGINQTICTNDNIVLNGSTTASGGTLNWSTSGSGVFLNGNSLTPTYIPSLADNISGSVTLTLTNFNPSNTCQNVNDAMLLTINRLAIADAGLDQTVCSNNNIVSLVGNVRGSVTRGSWRSLGTGVFTNASSLITNYTLSPNDIASGSVKLILTSSDPIGPCRPAVDTMIVTINQIATVDAGPDQIICSNSSVNITATLGGSASSGSWTSSTNSSFLSFGEVADYFPTPTEVLNGSVVLTYTSDDPIGPCGVAKDSLLVILVSPPIADAGLDQTVCSDVAKVNLIGNSGIGASTTNWSTLGTGTFTNATSLVTDYIFSTNDKSLGLVKLVLTSSDPIGPCSSNSDTLTIIIEPKATVDAGPDQVICGNSSVNIKGTVGGSATSGSWTSSSNSPFISFNAITDYLPTPTEVLNGIVVLTYTTNDPIGSCPAVKDSLIVALITPAFSNAGPDQSVCSNVTKVNLIGDFGNGASTATWSALGTGAFKNIVGKTAEYLPSTLDKFIGSVKILYTTDDPAGPCIQVVDTMVITFNPIATIFAGVDQTICRNNNVVLNASTSATSGITTWSTNGTGIFLNINSLRTTYIPSLSDNILGAVKLTVTNFDPINSCQNVNDVMTLTINQLALSNAGLDQTVCASLDSVSIVGNVSGSVSTGSWRTLGTGTFTNPTSLITNYKFSASDKAAGSVELILTSSNPVGPCNSVSDTMTITINPLATVDAGPDQTICGNSPATLIAVLGGSASSGSWTSSTNSPFISNTLATNYFPIPSEITNGSVVLTFTSDDPIGPCSAVADSLVVTINPAALVNAGVDQIICASNDTISLVGSISGSPTNVSWITLGSGTFTNDTSLNTQYILSASDKASGVVSLIFKDEQCLAVRDTVVITINQIPTVDAGPDQVICGNNSLNLVGIIGGSSTSGTWTSSTNSLFLSTDSTLIYTPTSSQIALGSFFITYTSNDPSGLCGIANDSMQVTVNIPPTVNAGKDIYTCLSASSVDIVGTQAGYPTNPLWVTLNGSGSFIDPTSLSTKYIPSAADLAAKSIIISLTTNDPVGPCFAAYDDVNVIFKDSNVTFTSVVQNIYCDSMEIKFVNDSNNVGYTYAWDFGDGFFSNIANPTHTYNYTGSINVSLVASGPGGCVENVNNTFNINSVKPRADFVVNNLNQCLNDNSFELNNASQDASVGYINNVKWDFGDNTNSTANIPANKTYNKAGNYNIKLVVSTTNGCQDSIVKGVNVLQSPEKPTVTVFDGKVLISSSLIANHWYYSNIEIPGAINKYYATSKFGVYKLRVDSTNGCSNFSDDIDLKYTSKTENVTNDKFKIYPNPTKGLFNIESQLDLNYSIYDYSGKEIITGKKDGNIQLLDLSNFNSGIYLIKLFNNQEQFISKIIKD
jgi:hypothetical protein